MTSSNTQAPRGIQLLGRINPAFAQILTPDALAFVAKLQRAFGGRREECLQRRQDRQIALHHGETLDFLPETKSIRESDWTCTPIPVDIQDRRSRSRDRPIVKW
jgi:malate synthase